MLSKHIGKNIKHFRKQRGLTQDQLAEAIGISTAGLRQIENGINNTTMDNFVKICTALDIPADFFLANIDRKFKIASVAQKWEYLAGLEDSEFDSFAEKIEFVYYCKTSISELPSVQSEEKEEALST
ncbi:MAG TPA: hypothetical protein DEB10_13135 [Ruminococcaceae bacterium]|jgi:transcriptional regulator with XRE-family HTH domain|nr:hypothetical protein [Oscillospiraceae bacterium]